MRLNRSLTLAAMIGLSASAASGQDAQSKPEPIGVNVPNRKEPVSYAKEVADILDNKCVGCHSEALAENKLLLDSVPAMLKGGKSGPAVVAGKADDSLLFKMAAHRIKPAMPPVEKKNLKPLTSDELGLLKLWIDAGAKDDSEENAEEAKPIELGTLPPGIHPINAVDITDDGARVACGRANVVQVYEAESGLEVISLGGHKDLIQSLRFSPDGRLLAAGSYEIVTLWNVPTGKLETTFSGHGEAVKALAALPEGKGYVSASTDKTIRFWNAAGKSERQISVPAPVLALAVTADGSKLAVGCGDNLVRVYNAADGKELRTFKGHGGPVNDVAFTPDAKHLVSASGDGTIKVWDLTAEPKKDEPGPEPVTLKGGKGPIQAVAVTPDGATVVGAGEDGKVRLWKLSGGDPTQTIDAHGAPVLALAISPDGKQILTGSADKTARLFDAATGELKTTLKSHNAAVQSVAFSPEGNRWITAGADGGIKVWDATNGQGVIAFGHAPAAGQPTQPIQRVIAPKAGLIVSASADKTLKSFSYEGTWSERRPLGPHTFRVLALDFNSDGTLLAAGAGEPSRTGQLKLWEVGKGIPVRTLDNLHSDTVFAVKFSPDGSKLASAGADKFMKVTRVSDGKELRAYEGHTHHVMGVDWSADGKQLITGGADNVLKLWDAESGEQVRTMQGPGKQVTGVRWVPGKPEIAGASGDKTVRVWNAGSGSVLRSFNGPSDYVFAVATSKDGSRLAAGGADGVLFLWNRQSGQVTRKIDPPATDDKAQARK